MRGQHLPVRRPMMQEKALSIAAELGLTDFKASTGWLRIFKGRHNISGGRICGESGTVNETIVDDWNEKLPAIIEGYPPYDILNVEN